MVEKNEKNIEVEKEKEINEAWDPFRVPTHLGGSFFDDPWMHPWIRRRGWRNTLQDLWFGKNAIKAPIDIKETKNNYEIFADIPGISKDSIDIHVTPNDIAIKGKIKTKNIKETGEYIWQERGYSLVARAIHFPNEVNPDKAEAKLEDGVLRVIVPKKKITLKEKGKRILVK